MLLADSITKAALKQLRTDGFSILKVSSETERIIQATFQAAREFFTESVDVKIVNRLADDWGYRPFGIEYSGSPEKPDLIESFSASFRNRNATNRLTSASAQNLYKQMLLSINILESIAERLTITIAEHLTHEKLSFLQGAFRNWSCLQVNHACFEAIDERLVNDLHEDGHLITVACSTGPGLELLLPNGAFLPVTTNANEVVIMPGEILWLLSGGYISPLYHRVRSEPQYNTRLAMLFFADIDPVLCKAWVTNQVNVDIDIGARVLTNGKRFGLDGFTLDTL